MPREGCVLLFRRAFVVRVMASAKDKRRGRVWSRDHGNFESHCEVHLTQLSFVQYGANLCCPRSQLETKSSFRMVVQIMQESVRAQAMRSCATKLWICGASQNHEITWVSRTQDMRAR